MVIHLLRYTEATQLWLTRVMHSVVVEISSLKDHYEADPAKLPLGESLAANQEIIVKLTTGKTSNRASHQHQSSQSMVQQAQLAPIQRTTTPLSQPTTITQPT